MSKPVRAFLGVAIALAFGAALGWSVAQMIRSDNMPFLVALGAMVGLLVGLIWAGLQHRATR